VVPCRGRGTRVCWSDGFLADFDATCEGADPSAGEWEAFLYGALNNIRQLATGEILTYSAPFTTRDLLTLMHSNGGLRTLAPADLEDAIVKQDPQMLARRLNVIKDRRFGEEAIYLTQEGMTRDKIVRWRIRGCESDESVGRQDCGRRRPPQTPAPTPRTSDTTRGSPYTPFSTGRPLHGPFTANFGFLIQASPLPHLGRIAGVGC
jgi:hypothetical protein